MQQKTFECSDDDFKVSGHDEQEIMQIARMHFRDKHQENYSDEEIKAKIKER